MSRRYIYCPKAHMTLLKGKPKETITNLDISLADLIERECADTFSGVDRQEIINLRREGKRCVDGDEYFSRFHPGEHEMDILLGVTEGSREKILIADCKIQMKGGASIANLKYLPDVCTNLHDKYYAAKKNIDTIVPITSMYVIFNHAVASLAKNILYRCSRGSNVKCRLASCFKFECLTIGDFRKLVECNQAI